MPIVNENVDTFATKRMVNSVRFVILSNAFRVAEDFGQTVALSRKCADSKVFLENFVYY